MALFRLLVWFVRSRLLRRVLRLLIRLLRRVGWRRLARAAVRRLNAPGRI